MKIINLTLLLQIAGVLHLGLLCANALMPRTVNLRVHIATLPPFIRQMFWVYYSFINLCLIGFALVTITLAGTLAGIFVFDMRPYLTTVGRRLGYYSINAVIVYLLVVYAWAAWKGGPL